ncbi:hypothetical protein Nmel_011664 [Mimus melanotis]
MSRDRLVAQIRGDRQVDCSRQRICGENTHPDVVRLSWG